MKISIKNVGIVAEAQVDLSKKLIVLCGPNNSGKTYIAYTIYGLLKTATQRTLMPSVPPLPRQLTELFVKDRWEFDLTFFLKPENAKALNSYVAGFKNSLHDVFAVAPGTFNDSELSILETDPEFLRKSLLLAEEKFPYVLAPGKTIRFEKKAGETVLKCWLERGTGISPEPVGDEETRRKNVITLFSEMIIRMSLFPKSFILPTQRTAVNIFSRELSLKRFQMVDRMLTLQEQKGSENAEVLAILREARRYTLPIRDSLLIADDLKEYEKTPSKFSELADALESFILKGKISLGGEGEVLFSPAEWNDLKITVNLSGSMVNSLSGLVFYFRYLAEEGDFIIFDEPELNLHPDNQIKIARFIALVVNKGFSVLLSTHSDYIIHELNHCIAFAEMSEENFKSFKDGYQYEDGNRLKSTDVQVLLFAADENPNGKKILAKEIPIGHDGFEVETIDKSIRQLNSVSRDLLLVRSSSEN